MPNSWEKAGTEAIDADDVIVDHCVDCYGAGIFVDVKPGVWNERFMQKILL